MLPKYLIALFVAAVSASPAPVPEAAPKVHLEKRAEWVGPVSAVSPRTKKYC